MSRFGESRPLRATLRVTLVDGVCIAVPDSLNLLTPFVLTEQQDWFEDEIKFLRGLLQAGDKVVDIGANFGTYTLSMAKVIGPTGRVFAFEPASSTAEYLAEGIAANGFSQVVLEQCALSSAPGNAALSLHDNSELNALVHGAAKGATEAVPVTTLDGCVDRYDWREIDFVKLDAEGEEVNILKGGARFFGQLNPLVQYEIKAGNTIDLSIHRAFAALGYNSYRLVPGLGILVPFDSETVPDSYLLNLFCCKLARAKTLGDRGLLLDSELHMRAAGKKRSRAIAEAIAAKGNPYAWQNSIAHLPYGVRFEREWEVRGREKNSAVDQALGLYSLSRDRRRRAIERFDALEVSFAMLKGVCERQPTVGRLASLARVALDFGARAQAVTALQQLLGILQEQVRVDFREPFLAPIARFEGIAPADSKDNWILAAALEAFELACAYSSFYSGESARGRLEALRDLGASNPDFASPEMARRLDLLRRRFPVDGDSPAIG